MGQVTSYFSEMLIGLSSASETKDVMQYKKIAVFHNFRGPFSS
jgi:hypothetical protein